MGRTSYTTLMYRRILKRLLEIQDSYFFDIYNYQTEVNPVSYSYLLVLHRNNGTALRKELTKIFTSQDSRTIFIVADQYTGNTLAFVSKRIVEPREL